MASNSLVVSGKDTITWTIRGKSVAESRGQYLRSEPFRLHGFLLYYKFKQDFEPKNKPKCADLQLNLEMLPPKVSRIVMRRKESLKETSTVLEHSATLKEDHMYDGWYPSTLLTEKIGDATSFTFEITLKLAVVYDIDGVDITEKYSQESQQQTQKKVVSEEKSAEDVEAQQVQIARLESLSVQVEQILTEIQAIKSRMNRIEQASSDDEKQMTVNEHLQKQIDELKKKITANRNNDSNESMDKEKLEFKNWVLNVLKLPEYFDLFVEQGVETLEVMKTLTKDDLKEMGISKIGHRNKIIKAMSAFKQGDNIQVQEGSTAYM